MKKYITQYLERLSWEDFLSVLNEYARPYDICCYKNTPDNLTTHINGDFSKLLGGSYRSSAPFYIQLWDGTLYSIDSPYSAQIEGRDAVSFLTNELVYDYIDSSLDCSQFFTEDNFLHIAHKAGVLPTQAVCEFIAQSDKIGLPEALVLWQLRQEFPSLATRVKVSTLKHFQKTFQFAEEHNQTESLLECFTRLSNWNSQYIAVYPDLSAHCFGFTAGSINGGIIYHGSPEAGYQENGSCQLEPTYGWQIHT